MSSIGERIRSLRKSQHINQQQFASIIGISQAHVSNIEKGQDNPSNKVLNVISAEFDINFNWLKTGEGEMWATTEPPSHEIKENLTQLKLYLDTLSAVDQEISSNLIAFIPELLKGEGVPKESRAYYLMAITSLFSTLQRLLKYLKTDALSNNPEIDPSDDKSQFDAKMSEWVDEVTSVINIYKGKLEHDIDKIQFSYLGQNLK